MWSDENLIKVLRGDGVVVMPTDTLYGIVGKASNASVVNRIYAIRKRNPEKPCIILIGDIIELEKFSIILSEEQKKVLEKYWSFDSIPVSVVLDCEDEKYEYLHRGTQTLAFRLPDLKELRELLLKTGPLIAPSANIEGMSPAQNISEAKKYFGDEIDLYIDGGEVKGKASRVIRLNKDGTIELLRD